MPKKNPDQPPADAIPLAEAFVQLMQPSAALIEVAREKAVSRNTGDWQTCLLERAVTAARDIACGRDPPPCGDEAAALLHEFRRRMAEGEGRTRGHEGSPIGLPRDLSQAWPHAQINGDGTVTVPGAPPIRFYRVTIQLRKPAKRGAPSKKIDEALLRELLSEMHAMIRDKGLKRHTAAMRLVEAGRVPGQNTTDESKAKWLVLQYDEWLKFREFEG